ncbi:alpha-galactosidase [Mucor mucedo]|uniref:alpha-galactosidase n=1 Tax=Mucor mucedo TaxID=29922 RepID=UPI00221FF787|nr:alpha-galactosidase [Mucor mucedo]KAI7892472.1 alpha-galactosidase [Mucor mucedo]
MRHSMQILKPGIAYHNVEHLWFLTTKNTSYVLGVVPDTGILLNLHWGPRLVTMKDINLPIELPKERSSQDPAITAAREEFPVFGGLRYGPDLLRAKFENGTRDLDLAYVSGEVENDELKILLLDRIHQNFQVQLVYTLDIENDLIVRQASIIAAETLNTYKISKALTAAWHIPPPANSSHRELITLAGAWAAETQVQKHSLQPGTSHVLQSVRGIPSAQAYPYFAVKDTTSDGEHSECEVYFGTLGWSGNWEIEVHTDIEGNIIVTGGINSRDFGCSLMRASFDLPVFVAGYTADGLSGARKSITNHIRENKVTQLISEPDTLAPVLYNGWEAYGFDVNITNQMEIARKAASLGTELFVLDDGWFRKRNSDKAGLGDWYHDTRKFPNGLKPLADYVHSLGMKFGLWFEPEMVNPDSDLYRKHPDWVYHYYERTRHLERNQLVLDITKPEVRHYLAERMLAIIKEVGVDYVKWDMNRPISEAGSRLGEEVWVAHVKSFHALVMIIKMAGSTVQIESCCSGGGRADMSILKKVESCWPSDNTRPDARLMIQYGSSLVIPPEMMSCWVTESPNDDYFTNIPISYRFHVSFMGALGIGSDLNKLTQSEFGDYKEWIRLYKRVKHIVQKGDLDWLVVPPNVNKLASSPSSYTAVTQTNSKKRDESIVLAFRQFSPFWLPLRPVRLRGLIPYAVYTVTIWKTDPRTPVYEGIMSGGSLMGKGLNLPYLTSKAYSSVVIYLKQMLDD